jgi:excisionase family DNA binding protein
MLYDIFYFVLSSIYWTINGEIVMDERWLSVDDVAEYLGIKRFTVYKWVQRLGLPARKIGRLLKFRKSEIDDWVENHSTTVQSTDLTSERLLQLLEQNSAEIKRFGVRRIGLFGSWIRGEGKAKSDIDVLVEFDQPSFDSYMELKFFLEDLFGRNVDLVLAGTLKESIRPIITREVRYVQGI